MQSKELLRRANQSKIADLVGEPEVQGTVAMKKTSVAVMVTLLLVGSRIHTQAPRVGSQTSNPERRRER